MNEAVGKKIERVVRVSDLERRETLRGELAVAEGQLRTLRSDFCTHVSLDRDPKDGFGTALHDAMKGLFTSRVIKLDDVLRDCLVTGLETRLRRIRDELSALEFDATQID